MNDIFSFNRFRLLLRKFIKEHASMYLLYIAAITGILLLIYGLTVVAVLNSRFPQDAAVIYYVMGAVFVGSLFASSFYGFFHNKAKGIQFINLPASASEKLLLGFLFTQVVFFVVFTCMFYCVDQLMVWAYNHFHSVPAEAPPQYKDMYLAKPLKFNQPIVKGGVIVAFVVAAISHFGSLHFEKNAFVKTALLIIIGGAAFVFYNFYGMKAMIPEETMPGGGPFFNESLRVGVSHDIRGIVYLPKGWQEFIQWFLPIVLFVSFWGGSYFKLKEKQV